MAISNGGKINGPAPKVTAPQNAPKKTLPGGQTGTPAPKKFDSNGKRIFSGTGSVTQNKKLPDIKTSSSMLKPGMTLPKSGAQAGKAMGAGMVAGRPTGTTSKPNPNKVGAKAGIAVGAAAAAANAKMVKTPKTGAQAGKAIGAAAGVAKTAPSFSGKMNQANPGKGSSVGSVLKNTVMASPQAKIAKAVVSKVSSVNKGIQNWTANSYAESRKVDGIKNKGLNTPSPRNTKGEIGRAITGVPKGKNVNTRQFGGQG